MHMRMKPPFPNPGSATGIPTVKLLFAAKAGGSALQSLTSAQRANILDKLARLVLEREHEIMESNRLDLYNATGLDPPLRSRLRLTREKLEGLSSGLQQLAVSVREGDHVRRTIRKTLVGRGLVLTQQKVPIGVLLVIFESRPDCLIQVREEERGEGERGNEGRKG